MTAQGRDGWGQRVAGWLAAALLALGAAGATPTAEAATLPATVVPHLGFLHVGAAAGPDRLAQIVDGAGRQILLRGVNLTGLRDDYVADGSLLPPYPETPAAYANGACPATNPGVYMAPVCAKDAGELAAYGYDIVRLTVSWSQLEPNPGHIDQGYIDRIAQVVDWLKSAGIYTLIDMHDDAWSKYLYTPKGGTCPPLTDTVGGFHEADGAPAWASEHVAPVCAAGGVRDLDAAVQEGFQRLYADLPGPDGIGLREHYAATVAALAARFQNDPAVAGYELLNEPEPGYLGPGTMDSTELYPFYARVIAQVRASVPHFRQLVFIEPDVTRNILDRSAPSPPWSLFSRYRNVVYAPHIYTNVFTLNTELGLSQLDPLYPSSGGYDTAASDARQLGLPLFIGEFGNGVDQDPTLLRSQYANQDRLGIGGTLWYWKGQSDRDGHWSVLYDDATHTDAAYPSRVTYTDRAYPIATAGTLTQLVENPDSGAITLTATSRRVDPDRPSHATVLYIPARDQAPVRATGASVLTTPGPSGAREAFVFPRGGAYTVSVAG